MRYSDIASSIKIILSLVTPIDRDAIIMNNAMRTDRKRGQDLERQRKKVKKVKKVKKLTMVQVG